MTIPCTLERIRTSDGIELCGLLSAASAPTNWGILHIHGLAGNFYEQGFIDTLITTGFTSGFRVFVFNNRGHDYFSDATIWNGATKATVAKGGAHERLDEGILDIAAAVDFLADRGLSNLVITAHSTGAVKAALYLLRRSDPRIRALAMLSPSDDVGIQKANAGNRFEGLLEAAKQLVQAGQPDQLMAEGSFFYPIDAKAYLELFDPEGIGNVFDMTNSGRGLKDLQAIKVPVWITFGSKDIAVIDDAKDAAARTLLSAIGSQDRSRFDIIEGAGHDYSGFEQELGSKLQSWLQSIRS